AGPMDFISYFIVHKVKASKKVQWIHFDINKIGFKPNFASKLYAFFDRVFVVSHEGRKKLVQKLPSIDKKTDVFANIISPKMVQEQALEGNGFEDSFDGIRI